MGNSSTLSSVQFVLREFSISLAWSGTWQPHTLTIGLSVVHCVKRRLNERMYWHNICLMCIKYGEEKQQCSCMNWTNFAFPIYCMNYMVVFWVWVKIDLKGWTFFSWIWGNPCKAENLIHSGMLIYDVLFVENCFIIEATWDATCLMFTLISNDLDALFVIKLLNERVHYGNIWKVYIGKRTNKIHSL